jgi:leader peptidase (prepilin peptidase) / N-methyltransferase
MISSLTIVFAVFAGLLGSAIGSFLVAVERRIGRGETFVNARSRCEHCGKQLRPIELIPIFSYLVQRGRCRSCHASIGADHLLVEVAAVVLSVVPVIWFFGDGGGVQDIARAAVTIGYTWILLAIFLIDLRHQIIPDWLTLPSIVFAAAMSMLVFEKSWQSLLLGAIVAGGFFGLQYLVSRGRWIGAGDIRLGVLMGAMLGLPATVVALFGGYILGAAIAVFLLMRNKASKETKLAFGTFLTVATLVSLYWGEDFALWYLRAIGL